MSVPGFDHRYLKELARGAKKTFENADQLYREARILGAAGAHARALFLHQISLEECAKVESIGWTATSLLLGFPIEEKKWLSSLGRHAHKNHTNAYALEGTAEEQAAKLRADWKAVSVAFKKFQADFHQESNWAKNASLYVDLSSGKFVGPSDQITLAMLAETAERNEHLLGFTAPAVRLLEKLGKEPEKFHRLLSGLLPQMQQISKLDTGPRAKAMAIEQLFREGLESALQEDFGPDR
jgi:AbiV family abortive infection protein